ncbi:hypothetical protein [Bordetella avium]|uniref:hypothetical protein n=1 Tax=Bordetella avium TaxID=521 RepID=UPI000FDA1E24|nr:hypothetical protein [Bordetella avium]
MSRLSGAMRLHRYEKRKASWHFRCRDWLFIREQAGAGLRLLLAASLAYLLAEFVFSAWLIHSLATDAGADELMWAAQHRRWLSACAVGLLLSPLLLRLGRRGAKLLLALSLTAMMAWAALDGEGMVLDHVARYSSPQARAASVAALQLGHSRAAHTVDPQAFEGLGDTGQVQSLPGKAFAAITAFLCAPFREEGGRPDGLDEAYSRFVRSQLAMQQRFEAYRNPQALRQAALHQGKAGREGRETYLLRTEVALRRQAGIEGVPPNLRLGEFAAHPNVQASWRALLDYPDTTPALSLEPIGRDTFAVRYFRPLDDARRQLPARDYGHVPAAYANGAERDAQGRQAFTLMAVSVLGLSLSILGIFLHLCRAGLLLAQAVSGWRFRHPGVELAALSLAVFLLCQLARSLPLEEAAQPAYRAWLQSQGFATGLFDAMIRAQSLVYPVFDSFWQMMPAVR